MALAAHSRSNQRAAANHASSGSLNAAGTAFATKMVSTYGITGVQAVVIDGNPMSGSRKPWLYATVETNGASGLRAEWQALLLASAYRAKAARAHAPAITGFSIVPASDESCRMPAANNCQARAIFSFERTPLRDPINWLSTEQSTEAAIRARVGRMEGAKLIDVRFAQGVYAPLPEVTIQASDTASFVKRYKYGSLAALGDDAKYEGYLVTVVDPNGDPISIQGESDALAIGIGWSRNAIHSSALRGGG
jgi:hypothetical protein